MGHVLPYNHPVCWGSDNACNAAALALISLCFVRCCMRFPGLHVSGLHVSGLRDFGASYIQHLV